MKELYNDPISDVLNDKFTTLIHETYQTYPLHMTVYIYKQTSDTYRYKLLSSTWDLHEHEHVFNEQLIGLYFQNTSIYKVIYKNGLMINLLISS